MKIKWLNSDSKSGTTEVRGSTSQYQAVIAVVIDTIDSKTKRETESYKTLHSKPGTCLN